MNEMGARVARRQRALEALTELVQSSNFRDELTWARLRERVGVPLHEDDAELRREFRRAKARLPLRRAIADGVTTLAGTSGHLLLERSRLRPDIAVAVWPLLQAESQRSDRPRSSIVRRFVAFLRAGELLGATGSSIETLTLERLQSAWFASRLAPGARDQARRGLHDLLGLRLAALTSGGPADASELARCAEWLESIRALPKRAADRALTAEESDLLVQRCSEIIAAGRRRLAEDSDLLAASTGPRAIGNAVDVADWGLALALLVGRFTGLRAGSIAGLRIDDLASIGRETYAVIWRHTKKAAPEERLAIVPASLAVLLREYDAALADVRTALGTRQLFVRPGFGGVWEPTVDFNVPLVSFVRRRLPDLRGTSLALMRRTFATRSLAEGRSLAAVSAQLGHAHLTTTMGYTKFERAIHAAETRAALDRFGRVVLERWKRPVLLADLEAGEQTLLEADAMRRDCEVGLCRPGVCVMIGAAGAPPPCLACEHLATSPAFFPAWEAEIAHRRERLTTLVAGEMPMVAANETTQLAEVERIYAELRARAASS